MKKVLAVLLVAVIAIACTACGVDMSKIKGEWTLDTINGAASPAVENISITSETAAVVTTADGAINYTVKVKGNGVELYDANNTLTYALAFDEKANTLTNTAKVDTTEYVSVYVKGTKEIAPAVDEAAPAEDATTEAPAEDAVSNEAAPAEDAVSSEEIAASSEELAAE